MSTLCPPAAAISKARFTCSWPFTSAKSRAGVDGLSRLPGRGGGDGLLPGEMPGQLGHVPQGIDRRDPGPGWPRRRFPPGGRAGVYPAGEPPWPWEAHRLRPQPPGEAQLPYEGRVGRKGRQLLRGSQDAQKDGQVVDRPLLALGGRGQVHGNAADGVLGPQFFTRRPNPLRASFTAVSGSPTISKAGQAAGEEALHAHLISAEAAQAQRAHGNDHVAHSFQRLDDNSHGSMRLALTRCRCPCSAYQIILILPQNHVAGNKNIKKVPIRCKNFCA